MCDRWLLVVGALTSLCLGVSACAPAGPSAEDLATTAPFAASPPGAGELEAGRAEARWSIGASSNSLADRVLVTEQSQADVVAWYAAVVDADGWQQTTSGYVDMIDGASTSSAWRKGDLVIGLGFPDRASLLRQGRSYPDGTLFEITITDQPVATNSP